MGRPSKEFQAFRELTDRLLAVPRSKIQERLTQHREASAQNPRKRGPKPKIKPSASDPSAE
jgi:hypothetical protein